MNGTGALSGDKHSRESLALNTSTRPFSRPVVALLCVSHIINWWSLANCCTSLPSFYAAASPRKGGWGGRGEVEVAWTFVATEFVIWRI